MDEDSGFHAEMMEIRNEFRTKKNEYQFTLKISYLGAILLVLICILFFRVYGEDMYVCEEHGQVYGYVEPGKFYQTWETEKEDETVCGICGRKRSN